MSDSLSPLEGALIKAFEREGELTREGIKDLKKPMDRVVQLLWGLMGIVVIAFLGLLAMKGVDPAEVADAAGKLLPSVEAGAERALLVP